MRFTYVTTYICSITSIGTFSVYPAPCTHIIHTENGGVMVLHFKADFQNFAIFKSAFPLLDLFVTF